MDLYRRDGEQLSAGYVYDFADVVPGVGELVAHAYSFDIGFVTHQSSLALAQMLGAGNDLLSRVTAFLEADRAKLVEVEHVRCICLAVRLVDERTPRTNQCDGIFLVFIQTAGRHIADFEVNLAAQPVHHQARDELFRHRRGNHQSCAIVQREQANHDDDPAFGITPGGQQPACIGELGYVLGELALKEFDCVGSTDCDLFVQLAIHLWHNSNMIDDKPGKSESVGPAVAPETENLDSNDNAGDADEGIAREKEIGGRDGPDPTRYGDWEKNGRCIDF